MTARVTSGETLVEWNVRWDDGEYEWPDEAQPIREDAARRLHEHYYPHRTVLVTRTVAVSPWRDAPPEGAS